MVITILQAEVAPDKVEALETAYREAIVRLDAGMVRTFLLRDARAPSSWQIVTVWESAEALEAMRQSGVTPRGITLFRAAGAEPRLSLFEVRAHAAASASTG
jgi:quinol monooxygenase YgiN